MADPVIIRRSGHQELDVLDAADIPALPYDASGAAATAASGAASALSAHEADTTSVHGIANTANLYVAGGTDVAVADGGTGAGTAAGARTNLGLVIGTDVQAFDADIPTVAASQAEMEAGTEAAIRSMSPLRVAQGIAALAGGGGAPADAPYLVTTASAGLSAEVVVPAAVLTVLDDTSIGAMRTTLDVPSNAEAILDALIDAKGDLIVGTAADTPTRLAVGATNGMHLAAASAATPGLRYDANPGRPGFRPGAGFYYSPPFVGGGLAVQTQNTLYAMPFYVPYDITTSSLSVAAGAVASATAQLGIYADAVGKPGALVVDAGNVSTASGGHKVINTATALTAGWYWVAVAVQGAAGNLFQAGNNGPSGNVAVYTPYAAASVAGYSQTGITGALPSPWGATFTEKPACPLVWVAF